MERLQKVLANRGVASRRRAEELILAGRVQVEGEVVLQLGTKVDPASEIRVDGVLVKSDPLAYVILNKPPGYVTTAHDPEGRPTVLELVDTPLRLFPVGRLDYDTAGLLLLTNDGELTNILTHPRYGVEKTYQAKVRGVPTSEELARLQRGIILADGPTQPAKVKLISTDGEQATLELTIAEGRKRQVRRMCEQIGHTVVELVRTSFGPLSLGSLPLGSVRQLNSREKRALEQLRSSKRKKEDLGGHTKGGGGGKNDHDQKWR